MIYDMRCVFLSILASSLPSMWLVDLLQSARPLTLIPPKSSKPFPQLEENMHHLFMLEESLEETPWKITPWNLKITCLKRTIIFQTSIFGFHVNFPECNPMNLFELRCGPMWKLKISPDSAIEAIDVWDGSHESRKAKNNCFGMGRSKKWIQCVVENSLGICLYIYIYYIYTFFLHLKT